MTVKLVADEGVSQEELEQAVKRDKEGIESELSKAANLAGDHADHWSGYIDDNRQYYIADVLEVNNVST